MYTELFHMSCKVLPSLEICCEMYDFLVVQYMESLHLPPKVVWLLVDHQKECLPQNVVHFWIQMLQVYGEFIMLLKMIFIFQVHELELVSYLCHLVRFVRNLRTIRPHYAIAHNICHFSSLLLPLSHTYVTLTLWPFKQR